MSERFPAILGLIRAELIGDTIRYEHNVNGLNQINAAVKRLGELNPALLDPGNVVLNADDLYPSAAR